MSPGGLPVGLSASFFERAVPVTLRYAASTSVEVRRDEARLRFAPNLAREPVVFDGSVRDPLPLREAMAALHAVVTADQRRRPSDRGAYRAWLQAVLDEETRAREQAGSMARARVMASPPAPLSPDEQRAFRAGRARYWQLRQRYERQLRAEDPALWRALVPCDPVCTVAPDVVVFEGFSRDASAWGAVVVDRDGFEGANDAQLGTTNVDYSAGLHDELERLRSYRRTRLSLDPGGLVVQTDGGGVVEQKIDLPAGWLRGFGQLTSTLFLPARALTLPVPFVQQLLAFLRTRREQQGPRALRFELVRGQPIAVLVEPWGARFVAEGTRYDGPRDERIDVWGRRRLFALERVLPLAFLHDGVVAVRLCGSGLPSLWSVRAGAVRFDLALSGWTANDWSGPLRLDLLAGAASAPPRVVDAAARYLQRQRTASLAEVRQATGASVEEARAAVVALARLGQVLGDFDGNRVRYRSVLDAPLSASLLGEDPPELVAGRALHALHGGRAVRVVRDDVTVAGRALVAVVTGEEGGRYEVESLLDADGVLTRARCGCSFHHRFALKKGPCRHLLALRLAAMERAP